MEEAMASPQDELRALFERRSEATWNKDIDRLMALYAPDVVYFDVVPPLHYTGSAALRKRFLDWFARWQGPIGQDIRDLSLSVSGDLAVAHMLVRASGTLQDGREVGYWVRVTDGCQRADRGWLIRHEHVSLPVEMGSGRAAMDLAP
jgi:ketosteroid isomerase-like protein